MATSSTTTPLSMVIVQAAMFPECAGAAILQHLRPGTTVVALQRGDKLCHIKSLASTVIYGTYYQAKEIQATCDRASTTLIRFAEDKKDYSSVVGQTVEVNSSKMDYPQATWISFADKQKEPANLLLVDQIAGNKLAEPNVRSAQQMLYVEYSQKLIEGAADVLFNAKFDLPSALQRGGLYAKKADSMTTYHVEKAGHYTLPLPAADGKGSVKKKLAIVNSALDIVAIGNLLLKAGADLALIYRFEFAENLPRYTLMTKPDSDLSAVDLAKTWYPNLSNGPGGKKTMAGWACEHELGTLLKHIGAQKNV